MGTKRLDVHVKAVANELETIIKLLGGTPEERWRAIEILTGLTTPAVVKVITAQLDMVASSLKAANTTLTTLKENATELRKPVM